MAHKSVNAKTVLAILLVAAAVFFGLYWCPFYEIAGIPCPGCHMTRALKALLEGNLMLSFYEHPMLIPTGAAAIMGIYFYIKGNKKGLNLILWIWVIAMLICWIVRMFLYFPDGIMNFNSNALIFRLFHD